MSSSPSTEQTQSALPIRRRSDAEEAPVPALTLIWSREEPERVGEVLLLPPSYLETHRWVGRGGGDVDPRTFAELFRQRPGLLENRGLLRSPRISRVQLELRYEGGALTIENRGRCQLLLNGQPQDRVTPSPGDILELADEALFLVELRPAMLPQAPNDFRARLHRFGDADELGFVGESPQLWALRRQLAFAGPLSQSHVLILGPSGSGKELAAHAIHRLSPRAERELLSRNAATLTETLMDAELFGTAKDFPQGGMPARPGIIGAADGSTLFLDEIAELPEGSQVRLLRVLDRGGEYQVLGETRLRKSNLRLIGATNRPLEFLKHDLLARFKLRVEVPGLNERRADIPLIARQLLISAAREHRDVSRFLEGEGPAVSPLFTPELVAALVQHPWTTHVRELEAVLWQSIRESADEFLELTPGVRSRLTQAQATSPPEPPNPTLTTPQREVAPMPWTASELERLTLLRRHAFHPGTCGQDPAYSGGRQKADLHIRQLFCRALRLSHWHEPTALAWLTGEGQEFLHAPLTKRLRTFLTNLSARVLEARNDPQTWARLLAAIADEYKAYRDDVHWVVDRLLEKERTP